MTTSPARPTCDVCLVNMPFVALERPSLATGLLRASAAAAGLCAHGVHPSFPFAELVGPALYSRILHRAPDQNIGDWLFAGAAFPGESARHAAFVDQLDKRRVASWLCVRPQALETMLWQLRAQAEVLVARIARLIIGTGARIVGCSSVFQQQVASRALLRTVKALEPSIQTMLGGANCEAQMGAAVHHSFDWVDYVVSGEADLLFGELCVRILAEDPRLDTTLPSGVLGPAHRSTGPPTSAHGPSPGRAALHDLDASHLPEFDDYFAALGQSSLRTSIHPALLVETARGCRWGEKHHCTFCGLNGDDMRYRPKSSARVLEEFAYLTARYATLRLLVVDNILHQQHLATVIPALIEAGAPYSIFYETKANLSAQQIEQLSRAGVRRVQPGFESLHLGALELLNKGTTPVINLQYLKTARWLATFVTWNFLWEIPGESPVSGLRWRRTVMSINRETLNFLEALDQDAGMQADLEAALARNRPPIPTIVTFAAEAGFKIDPADIEAVRQLLDTAAKADDVEIDEAGLDAIAGGFNPQPEPPARISSGNSAILNRSFIHRFFGR